MYKNTNMSKDRKDYIQGTQTSKETLGFKQVLQFKLLNKAAISQKHLHIPMHPLEISLQ